MRARTLTLWDCAAEPTDEEATVYCWNGYVETDRVRSLLRYVETHSERLRRQYLAWIHDLGETRIAGKRLVDHLAVEEGLSYWWMTLFVEKSPWKSPVIVDAIRLLALEEIIREASPAQLRLVSANRRLHGVLSALCLSLDIAYEWRPLSERRSLRSAALAAYRALPQSAQAIVSLVRHLRARWTLRSAQRSSWFEGARSRFFCSYFIHLNQESCRSGSFHSHQWEDLPKLLHDSGYGTNWVQHYLQSGAVPNTEVAKGLVRRFNQHRSQQGVHTFLDAYLSWRLVFRVVKRWLALNLVNRRLRQISGSFSPHGSHLSFWPLMQADWQTSLCGSVAITNLLWIELFDRALRDLPPQQQGLYLCENQAWERALIHAWRKHGHGELIGVAHSTVRFWDLRYFFDPRSVCSADPYRLPQPDLVALNGKVAVDAYRSIDFPSEAVVECEALRYGYLHDRRVAAPPASRGNAAREIRVLILGDYLSANTIKMLRLLEAAIVRMPPHVTYTMKPHPNYPVRAEDYPDLRLRIRTDHLTQVLHDFDIVYSSNTTSAGVDAYLVGLPVVVMLNETELNFSPLRNQPGVSFITAPGELAEALQRAGLEGNERAQQSEFFFLDPELPRWKRLLRLGAVANQ